MCFCELSAQQIVVISTTLTGILSDGCNPEELEIIIIILQQLTNSLQAIVKIDYLQEKLCVLDK